MIVSAILISLFLNYRKKQVMEIVRKAQLERDLENFPKSIELYKTGIKQDNRNPYLYQEYGEVQMIMKDYKDAISSFSKVIELKPDYDPPYLRRAHAYIEIRNYRKALEDCNQVINTKASCSAPLGAYLMRGTVFIYLRNFERALSEFNVALRLNPDFFLVYTCRAEVYCYLGKYKQALENTQKSLELNPDLDITYLWRGWANYGLSNFREALEDCNRYLEKDKEAPKAFEVRGLIYKSTNNIDNALADLEQAAKIYKRQHLHDFCQDVQNHIKELTDNKTNDRTKSS